LREVAKEVDAWRGQAALIPDTAIREDALGALAHKRPHLDGAALFCILPRRRNLCLLRLLVAYELILEFLDNMNERAACAGIANGRQLHLALIEALDPDIPISDYYRHHPWRNDGGYLRSLVEACRTHCMSLVSYSRVRRLVVKEASRTQVLALNHDPHPCRRDAALRSWVEREFPGETQVTWFELSGAATAPLTIHMLLALAAEPVCSDSEISDARAVYFPGLSLVATMLDSYVDKAQDIATNGHSYIAHYPNSELATLRIGGLITQSINDAYRLRKGHRHVVVAACMIAMYLSSDSALEPKRRQTSLELACAGGACTRLLLPILRVWRVAYALRTA
jgi:tetraprenyl-beta-curcumene synthase